MEPRGRRVVVFAVTLLTLAAAGGGVWWYLPIYQAKEAVRKQLNDPASAQFREVWVSDRFFVCGEVNAKNRMGGYAGFSWFEAFPTDTDGWHVTIDRDAGGEAKAMCASHRSGS